MSLNWDVSKIKDHEVCWVKSADGTDRMSPITEALLWATLAIGIGEWTEKNATEVYTRLKLVEKVSGPFLVSDGKPRFFTEEEVQNHIGLRTNAPSQTKTAFHSGLMRVVRGRIEREIRDARREKEEVRPWRATSG